MSRRVRRERFSLHINVDNDVQLDGRHSRDLYVSPRVYVNKIRDCHDEKKTMIYDCAGRNAQT